MSQGALIFLSDRNSIRGQMAEGFARYINKNGIDVYSAAFGSVTEVHPLAVEVMDEFGIDISAQKSKQVVDLVDNQFDVAIQLGQIGETDGRVLSGAPTTIQWDITPDLSSDLATSELKDQMRAYARALRSMVADLFSLGYIEALITQQNQLNSVLNSVTDAVIGHDLKRRIFFFSEGASKLTGLNPSQVIGRDCNSVFTPRLCGEDCSFCYKTVDPDFERLRYTNVFYDPDGNRKDLDVSVIPLKSTKGDLSGVLAFMRDITNLRELEQKLGEASGFRGIIGRDPTMAQLFQQIKDLSAYDYPVHIHGETGVGKELVAKAIHEESVRANGPFVPINCGALPEGLVESELFGHVKGAFSGAIRNKKGRFELANGGTLFLDEVADLPKPIQVKLLRFLQEGTLEKVGSETEISVDVRIISATNKDLQQEVKKGNFRDDLYYRLNVIPVNLPPLRKRKNDIELLANYFLKESNPAGDAVTVSPEALDIMLAYGWPGNVRELENAIRFSIVRSRGTVILPEHLPLELKKNTELSTQRGPDKKLEPGIVREALNKAGGNKAKTARILGVGRATVYRFLNEHPDLLGDFQ